MQIRGERPTEVGQDEQPLTTQQALGLLPAGDHIHIYINQPESPMLVGFERLRAQVEELVAQHSCELAGATAASMGHGLVVDVGGKFHFIATDAEALARLEEELS